MDRDAFGIPALPPNRQFSDSRFGYHLFMTRALTRTPFHSSALLRILTELACLETAPGVGAFAEKLGLWVDYTDAITLCAVHSNANPPSAGGRAAPAAAVAEFAHARGALERAITTAALPEPDLAGARVGDAFDITVAFEPLRRHYVAQQRELDLKVAPLHARVREELARASPKLRQLAALDAALGGILQARESRLLGTLPLLLKRRFGHLLKTHRLQHADATPTEQARAWQGPGAWLARFGQELQSVLLAELELRLQPAQGLIEALHHHTQKSP